MPSSQRGFSMVELTVAMTITLIISGAIYAMLAGGSASFRREPAVADRQQNIRVAVDLITRDVRSGRGFVGADAAGIAGPNGTTDGLQMFVPSENCPDVQTTNNPTGQNINTITGDVIPGCYPDDSLEIIYFQDGTTGIGFGHNVHAGDTMINYPTGAIDPTGLNGNIDGQGNAVNHLTAPTVPVRMGKGSFVKWQIANDTDGTPSLWRTDSGGFYNTGTGAWNSLQSPQAPYWQLVARGIEDMQVKFRVQGNYSSADLTTGWTDAPSGGSGTLGNMVREVRVTLQARTVGERSLAGESSASPAPTAVRGQLTTVVVPQYSLDQLAGANLFK
jgi:prepilin-type N-terminal cleavage/methylation domain-containing protein